MIKNFKPRLYQEMILGTASKKNTLIVLPTGMGKTNVFLMIAANRLSNFPKGRVVLVGPTKPLIDQYFKVFDQHFEIEKARMSIMTGAVKPEKRAEKWAFSQIIFTTPQGLENDVMKGTISLEDVVLIGFDEAHRAVGDYSYVRIADKYLKTADFPRIIGMTASPGSDSEKIEEVCENLGIEDVEVKNEEDPDVKPYVQEIETRQVRVRLPESFKEIKRDLERCIASKADLIKKLTFINAGVGTSRSQLLRLQAQISKGRLSGTALKSLSLIAEAMKASHALELLESQGIEPLIKYMHRLQEDGETTKVKAVRNLLADPSFQDAIRKTNRLYESGEDHPKLKELVRMIREELKTGKEKIIIFNQFRDSALSIKKTIEREAEARAEIFVGQAKRGETGLSQKEQKAMLQDFREGKFSVLIATSIGEEGLDIVKVDTVIFYEPTASAIRSIQRRGRTGRQEKGRVIILIAEGTRDEAINWVSQKKEQKMYRILRDVKNRIKIRKREKLTGYFERSEKKVKMFADHRENGALVKLLSDRNVDLEIKTLEVADYVCSTRVGVEVKTCNDFVSSITDGRILNQVRELKTHYEKPLVIVQGNPEEYALRSVHPNAIRGMIAAITVDYGIPLISTKNEEETAELLVAIAKREQVDGQKEKEIQNHSRKPLTTKELQEYLVSALPGVETKIAKSLLKEFKTVKNVINASEEMLKSAEFVGDRKASEIRKVLDQEYSQD